MTVPVDADVLGAMCFRRVPADVMSRDVVLAALWHLYVKAAAAGLPTTPDRTFRHTLLGQRSGLGKSEYRAALAELRHDGLIGGARNGYCLTTAGFAAVREIVDVDHTLELAKAARAA